MANIIVCCDGTWNTAEQKQDDVPAPTNVVKLFNALAATDDEGVRQKKYYHPGVGTEGGWFARLKGGGLGDGLDQNIRSAYKWLAVNYRPGDRIFLFGFSRGAYTVRSLAGMMSRCGLLDLSSPDLPPAVAWAAVADIFRCYRQKLPAKAPPNLSFHAAYSETVAGPEIHFLGVWDTVGALGIPDDLAFFNFFFDRKRAHQFHDTNLGPAVRNARHAVAMDEQRQSFTPTLWTNLDDRPEAKQIWFPGVHCDVGGGYARSGLSDGALHWMIGEANDLLLRFRPQALEQIVPNPLDYRHDSDTGLFSTLKALPRNVPQVEDDNADLFAQTATARHDNPPLYEAEYWPNNPLGVETTVYARQKWNATGLFLEADADYEFTAGGEWKDGSIVCGPAGAEDGRPSLAKLAYVVGTLLGMIEALFRHLTGNSRADFWFTKREERFPWFALVGVIANGIGADGDGNPRPHEVFLIGTGCRHRPKAAGYLYAFTNDAWQTYGNNNGSVTLTVKRGTPAPRLTGAPRP